MALSLGDSQAQYQFNEQGQDYAGGYPEILIELGGFWTAIGLIIAISIVNAALYLLVVDGVARGYFLTAIMATYVGYGVSGVYLGGMLNFILAASYWMKFAALVFVFVLDRGLARFGYRVFPWAFLKAPQPILREAA
jgi:hypothetical protein